jgi:apolipoprotein N-acyltransferase
MINRRTTNKSHGRRSSYLYAAIVGITGVVIFILGFIIPGWVWLAWVGFALIVAAIYILRTWNIGPFLPHFSTWKEGDDGTGSPPFPPLE